MVLTDELCDRMCAAAREKSRELGIDISFAVCDSSGLPRVYRRYGDALVLSITLVPGKAYTAAVTQCRTKDVAACAAEGASLMAIQTNDPRITLVAGGYPLFADGKIIGGIGVDGGSEAQDCEIAEYVVSVFEQAAKKAIANRRMPAKDLNGLPDAFKSRPELVRLSGSGGDSVCRQAARHPIIQENKKERLFFAVRAFKKQTL